MRRRNPSVLDWLDFYFAELGGWRRRRRAARRARRDAGPGDLEPPTERIPRVQ